MAAAKLAIYADSKLVKLLPIITRLSRDQKQIRKPFFLGYVLLDLGKHVDTEGVMKKYFECKDSSENV